MVRRKVTGTTEKETWQYVWMAGAQSLWRIEQARKRAKAPKFSVLHEGMKALLCSAMGFEGFVNWLGEECCPRHWWETTAKFGVVQKLQLIAAERHLKLDFGKEPFQRWPGHIKPFRDALAHPRLATASKTFLAEGEAWEVRVSDGIPLAWEVECSPPELERNLKALNDMRQALCRDTGVHVGAMSRGSGTAVEVDRAGSSSRAIQRGAARRRR